LAGRQNLENPHGPINLIHLDDCVSIIQKIIEKEVWNETLNAVAPFHPSRKDYYTQKAIELSLATPQFCNEPSFGKTINSFKLIDLLNYSFIGNY
jgi:NAD dependent epimerase/dehydratase family enzyme